MWVCTIALPEDGPRFGLAIEMGPLVGLTRIAGAVALSTMGLAHLSGLDRNLHQG